MAQTRPSPTLSRGCTRLGRFLAPYGNVTDETIAEYIRAQDADPTADERFKVSD